MTLLQAQTSTVQVSRRRRRAVRIDWLGATCATLLLTLTLVGLLARWLPVGDPNATGGPRLSAPSPEFLAGTDSLGRSVLPRLLQGVLTTFALTAISVLLMVVISIVLGVVAGYFRGPVGEIVTRGADVLFAFPAVLLGILVVAIAGPGTWGAIVSVVIITCPLMIRVVRAASLTVADRDFVLASRVGGASIWRVMGVHVLPNITGVVIVQSTYALSVAMLVESSLSFLGLGVQPPDASLGSLVYEGSTYLPIAPWLVLIPGTVLALAILSVNLVGDWLRDALDVRGEVRTS